METKLPRIPFIPVEWVEHSADAFYRGQKAVCYSYLTPIDRRDGLDRRLAASAGRRVSEFEQLVFDHLGDYFSTELKTRWQQKQNDVSSCNSQKPILVENELQGGLLPRSLTEQDAFGTVDLHAA